MGNKFADQYSFLHFCVGAVAYYWQLSLRDAFILHFIFEIVENTPLGMRFINRFFVRSGSFGWPGGKDKPDSALNIVGDNAFFVLGWITAQKLDEVGTELGWYERHDKNVNRLQWYTCCVTLNVFLPRRTCYVRVGA